MSLKPEDIIARANHHGATFEQRSDGEWACTFKKRGWSTIVFVDAKQAEAAAMFLRYFGHKE